MSYSLTEAFAYGLGPRGSAVEARAMPRLRVDCYEYSPVFRPFSSRNADVTGFSAGVADFFFPVDDSEADAFISEAFRQIWPPHALLDPAWTSYIPSYKSTLFVPDGNSAFGQYDDTFVSWFSRPEDHVNYGANVAPINFYRVSVASASDALGTSQLGPMNAGEHRVVRSVPPANRAIGPAFLAAGFAYCGIPRISWAVNQGDVMWAVLGTQQYRWGKRFTLSPEDSLAFLSRLRGSCLARASAMELTRRRTSTAVLTEQYKQVLAALRKVKT